MIYREMTQLVGNTPMIQLKLDELKKVNLYAKLECNNPTGSVKDRAASNILMTLLESKEITHNTTIIESSSGNFGIALSYFCKMFNLPFYCVIDPNISPINEKIIRLNATKVIKVTEPDENGGYLLNRIKKVKELKSMIADSYWVNQYGNWLNAESYYNTLGEEICKDLPNADYVFLGVSSGGTITGTSRKIKEKLPNAKVIAVDIVGSVVFGGEPKKRYIPGIGSSMQPSILQRSKIDEVIMIDEMKTAQACHTILDKHHCFVGGSSGSVYAAVLEYFKYRKVDKETNVAIIFADRGERYIDTVYNTDWCNKYLKSSEFDADIRELI